MGVDAVSLLVKEHLVSRHKLVVIHVGTNDLAGGVLVHALYDKLCSLNGCLPTGTQLCVSEVFRRGKQSPRLLVLLLTVWASPIQQKCRPTEPLAVSL